MLSLLQSFKENTGLLYYLHFPSFRAPLFNEIATEQF
jgi:hypothetical protein